MGKSSRWKMSGYKKGMINRIALLVFCAILTIVFLILAKSLEMPFLYVVVGIYVIIIFYSIHTIKKLNDNYDEMENIVFTAKTNYEEIRKSINASGFITDKHLSAFGYKWIELRNDFKVIDNYHLEIDELNKRIAYYNLIPKMLEFIEFSDVVSSKLISNSTNNLITEYYVEFTFRKKGGISSGILPVNDNQTFDMYSPHASNFKKQADEVNKLFEEIIEKGKV